MARPPPTESPPLFAHTRSLTTTPPDDGWEGSQPKRTKRRGKPVKPTKEVSTMKQEVRTAFAAATAATAAAQFARTAENLARVSPPEWDSSTRPTGSAELRA